MINWLDRTEHDPYLHDPYLHDPAVKRVRYDQKEASVMRCWHAGWPCWRHSGEAMLTRGVAAVRPYWRCGRDAMLG